MGCSNVEPDTKHLLLRDSSPLVSEFSGQFQLASNIGGAGQTVRALAGSRGSSYLCWQLSAVDKHTGGTIGSSGRKRGCNRHTRYASSVYPERHGSKSIPASFVELWPVQT